MQAASSPASEDSILASASLPPGSASTTSTAEPCLSATGPESPATKTCANSGITPPESTSSTADTPASRSAQQESARGKPTPGTSGPSSPDSFAYFDPESSSLRTSQATFDLGFTPSLPTLPAWGWMSGGELFERPMSVPLTSVPDSSSLLQTPSAADAMGGHLSRGGARSHELLLKGQLKALPTPQASRGASQTETVALLPTPNASVANDGETPETWLPLTIAVQLLPTPAASDSKGGRNTEGHSPMLPTAARMLPTPTVGDSKQARNSTAKRHKLPPTGIHAGDTLTDAVTLLLPTPTTEPMTGNGHARNLGREAKRLPTPTADGGMRNTNDTSDYLTLSGALTRLRSVDGSESSETPHDPPTGEAA